MINKFFSKLREPFPERRGVNQSRIDAAFVSLFVAAFLYFFNPFRIEVMPIGLELAALGFGVVCFFCAVSFDWFINTVIRIRTDMPTWTLWKWIVFQAVLICWVALGNFTFLVLTMPESFGVVQFTSMLKNTLMVGITPIAISGMLIQIRATHVHQNDASQIERVGKHYQPIVSHSDRASDRQSDDTMIDFEVGSGESISLSTGSIRVIEAMQNYVMVYHYDSNSDEIRESIIRSTLVALAGKLDQSSVVRSHRSFLVNLAHVEKVEGNAQGLLLTVNKLGSKTVPVSRSYISRIKAALK